MWVAFFTMQKLLTFFQQKISMYLPYFKFEILTSCKLITSLLFEQLGPDCMDAETDLSLHWAVVIAVPQVIFLIHYQTF